ncbi:MAG: magnesium/cobalt transporter CorA [Candidatus Kerfeldbacteria bacterium]|nr:magnesium/cobalt transporter CorA [Candidatus Kerfeldbacteria bacterium]
MARLLHLDHKKSHHSVSTDISAYQYNADHFSKHQGLAAHRLADLQQRTGVLWLTVTGSCTPELLQTVSTLYQLHPLVQEGIRTPEQRPRTQNFGEYIYISFYIPSYRQSNHTIDMHHAVIILGSDYVLTFVEQPTAIMEQIQGLIEQANSQLRRQGADYLTYTILDHVVDQYFDILDAWSGLVETFEGKVVTEPKPTTLQQVNALRREMIIFRKSVWPLREAIADLERDDSNLIQSSTRLHLRDVHDHVYQVIDTIQTFWDIMSGLAEVYLSSVSNRLNEIMKVLTAISTIFIPLTFIAGVYGMNFKYMPELNWHWGYFVVISLMLVVGGGLAVYFRNRKWL